MADALAKLIDLAAKQSDGGALDDAKIRAAQAAGPVLEEQIRVVAERMAEALRHPPQAGQNISERAKQQARRQRALDAKVDVVEGFDAWLIAEDDVKAIKGESRKRGRPNAEIEAVTRAVNLGAAVRAEVERFAISEYLVSPEEVSWLTCATRIPASVPQGFQAKRLLAVLERCRNDGLPLDGPLA